MFEKFVRLVLGSLTVVTCNNDMQVWGNQRTAHFRQALLYLFGDDGRIGSGSLCDRDGHCGKLVRWILESLAGGEEHIIIGLRRTLCYLGNIAQKDQMSRGCADYR